MVHAVEDGCLVLGELAVAEVVLERREAGEGVLTRVSLLLAEADSFVRPQYLRAGKVLNLGGRAVCGRERRRMGPETAAVGFACPKGEVTASLDPNSAAW